MGVPQGSIVSPLLFIALLSDPGLRLRGSSIISTYADDICLFRQTYAKRCLRANRRLTLEAKRFQEDSDTVVEHLEELGFIVNEGKTVFMVFNTTLLSDLSLEVGYSVLTPQKEVVYLGVVFTYTLSWTPHVNRVLAGAHRAINLIRSSLREPWGKNRKHGVQMVLALVRSRLLYGLETARDLTATALKRMVACECGILRRVLGLPTGTPQGLVYREAGVLPLWNRARLSMAKFCVGAAAGDGPARDVVTEESLWRWPKTRRGKYPSLEAQVADLVREGGVDPQAIPVPGPPPWPPDYFETPAVCLEVGLDVTKRDNPALLKATFLDWVSRIYQGQHLVYTDGSLNGRSGGAGVFVPHLDIRRSYSLGCGSSMEAELAAKLMALSELEGLPPGGPGMVICSDSLSALQVVRGADGRVAGLATDIIASLTRLARVGTPVTLQWVPAHVGVAGNEVADSLARLGQGGLSCGGRAAPKIALPPSLEGARTALGGAAWRLWAREFGNLAGVRGWPSGVPPQRGTRWANYPTALACVMSRLCCNTWRVKHCRVPCVCGDEVSFDHCLFGCGTLGDVFLPVLRRLREERLPLDMASLLSVGEADPAFLAETAGLIMTSRVGPYL